VVDEKAPADFRPRMDFDAGQPAPQMREKTRQPAQPVSPQPVRQAMHDPGVDARIAGQHLPE
jgi:hypothetical protein